MAGKITLKPVQPERMIVTIEGISPIIQHQWNEKAKQMMRDKHAGKKTKTREKRDPAAEAEAATYRTADGEFGVPVAALAKCVIGAAHKDIGVEKTLVRKALFILCDDPNGVIPMTCSEPRLREDAVRVGAGSADLRYRPQFDKWETEFTVEYNPDMLQPEDILNLINLAGFGVGVCEWRPEKGGDFGRFRVKAGA
jgi:hypothetical protein